MAMLFTPKGFLTVGGLVLLLLGIVGFLGIFTMSIFYLTSGENFAHVAGSWYEQVATVVVD